MGEGSGLVEIFLLYIHFLQLAKNFSLLWNIYYFPIMFIYFHSEKLTWKNHFIKKKRMREKGGNWLRPRQDASGPSVSSQFNAPGPEVVPVLVSLAQPVWWPLICWVAEAASAPKPLKVHCSHVHQWLLITSPCDPLAMDGCKKEGDGYQVGQFWDVLHAAYQSISWDWALVGHRSNLFNNVGIAFLPRPLSFPYSSVHRS